MKLKEILEKYEEGNFMSLSLRKIRVVIKEVYKGKEKRERNDTG